MDLTEEQKARAARWQSSCNVFATIPGAERLISEYGKFPSFHDGEVEAVYLTKKGPSKISISISYPTNFSTEMIMVSFTAQQVIDVALEGFSSQNVLWELWARVPLAKPGYDVLEGDLELELDPTFGLGGTIWLRNVEVSWGALVLSDLEDFGGAWAD